MADVTATSDILPIEGKGLRSAAWWGTLCLIATEAILFVYLIFSYAYLGSQSQGPWPPNGAPRLDACRAGHDPPAGIKSRSAMGRTCLRSAPRSGDPSACACAATL